MEIAKKGEKPPQRVYSRKTDGFEHIIEEKVKTTAPAIAIYHYLAKEHGYTGSYSTIKRYIHNLNIEKQNTKEQREQARRTDLAQFLIIQGEKVKKSGSEYEWLDGSQKVTIRGHLWYHQYEQKGGDAVDSVKSLMTSTGFYPTAIQLNCMN